MVSQLKDVNLGEYKRMEDRWAQALKEGKQVTVDMKINYEGNFTRPSNFEVEYTINGEYYFQDIPN